VNISVFRALKQGVAVQAILPAVFGRLLGRDSDRRKPGRENRPRDSVTTGVVAPTVAAPVVAFVSVDGRSSCEVLDRGSSFSGGIVVIRMSEV
jgi:hypothetical protein